MALAAGLSRLPAHVRLGGGRGGADDGDDAEDGGPLDEALTVRGGSGDNDKGPTKLRGPKDMGPIFPDVPPPLPRLQYIFPSTNTLKEHKHTHIYIHFDRRASTTATAWTTRAPGVAVPKGGSSSSSSSSQHHHNRHQNHQQ